MNDLICKCGGELNSVLHCKECGRTWEVVEDWMDYAKYRRDNRQFSPAQQAFIVAAELEAEEPN